MPLFLFSIYGKIKPAICMEKKFYLKTPPVFYFMETDL